jgi:hypothetical protein
MLVSSGFEKREGEKYCFPKVREAATNERFISAHKHS